MYPNFIQTLILGHSPRRQDRVQNILGLSHSRGLVCLALKAEIRQGVESEWRVCLHGDGEMYSRLIEAFHDDEWAGRERRQGKA